MQELWTRFCAHHFGSLTTTLLVMTSPLHFGYSGDKNTAATVAAKPFVTQGFMCILHRWELYRGTFYRLQESSAIFIAKDSYFYILLQ